MTYQECMESCAKRHWTHRDDVAPFANLAGDLLLRLVRDNSAMEALITDNGLDPSEASHVAFALGAALQASLRRDGMMIGA